MFNEDIKKRYIAEKENSTTVDKHYLPNLFKKCEPFEQKLDKDVCNFTTREIENMMKTINFSSFESIGVANSSLSQYTMWCMKQGLVFDSQNHYLELNRPRLAELVNKTVQNMRIVTREKVLDWCFEMPNPSDQFIMLGLFEGIKGQDFCEFTMMRNEDVHLESRTITLPNRGDMKFSYELCSFGVQSAEATEYFSVSGKMERIVPVAESGYIIKNYPNVVEGVSQFQKGRRIYNRLTRAFSFLGINGWMSASALMDSGIVHMVRSRSEELGISCDEYMSTRIDELSKRYDKRILKSTLMNKYGDYLV